MARARNIKPGFFKNESLAECTPWARLCFAGLWTLADREGRLEDRPKRIKGELFAFDSVEVDPLLKELERFGFVQRYASDGLGVIQILSFHKHQNPHHREPKSDLPSPKSLGLYAVAISSKPEANACCNEQLAPCQPRASPGLDPPRSDLARGSSRAESGALNPEQGIRSPESGKDMGSARKRASRTRFPDDFAPNDSGVKAATDAGLNVQAELQRFRNHHEATGSLMASWQAAWRTWVGKAVEFGHGKPAKAVNGNTDWLVATGFPNIAEAQNCHCHIGNANLFRNGKRIGVEP